MNEPPAPSRRIDWTAIMRSALVLRADPLHALWLKADRAGYPIYVRINPAFPDEPLYSLLIDVDETYDFDDLPPRWSREGPLEWPKLEPPPRMATSDRPRAEGLAWGAGDRAKVLLGDLEDHLRSERGRAAQERDSATSDEQLDLAIAYVEKARTALVEGRIAQATGMVGRVVRLGLDEWSLTSLVVVEAIDCRRELEKLGDGCA